MLLLIMLGAAGCDNGLDPIYGHDLGEPTSVVFGQNGLGDTMVIFSSLPDLCSRLQDTTPPDEDYWIVSAWTSLPQAGAGGFAGFYEHDQTEEYDADRAQVDAERFREADGRLYLPYDPYEDFNGTLKGEVTLSFGQGGTLEATFEASYCSAPLFNGLQ